jgi:hypothetical protein
MISGRCDRHLRSGSRPRKDDPIQCISVRTAYATGGICPMKLMDAIVLIHFVDNGWSLAALIAVLAFLYLTRT